MTDRSPDHDDPYTVRTGALIPEGVRQRITTEDYVEDPYLLTESPEERSRRLTMRHESKIRMWEAGVPKRFRGASVADLTPEQDPDEKVSGWWKSRSDNLVIRSAEPGVGKSHAAYAVGNEAVTAVGGAAWAHAWTMIDLNDAIRPGNDPTAYAVARACALLVIDDLGRETVSPWTLERLQGILDARWSNELRTVVTTNLDGAKFLNRYGDPIVDRLKDGMTYVEIQGNSRRRVAPW